MQFCNMNREAQLVCHHHHHHHHPVDPFPSAIQLGLNKSFPLLPVDRHFTGLLPILLSQIFAPLIYFSTILHQVARGLSTFLLPSWRPLQCPSGILIQLHPQTMHSLPSPLRHVHLVKMLVTFQLMQRSNHMQNYSQYPIHVTV